MPCVSSGIQDQILLLLDIVLPLEYCEIVKKWEQPVPDHFGYSDEFFIETYFLDNGLRSQQLTVQLFRNRINFEGFAIDFKCSMWLLWSNCLIVDERKCPKIWKKSALTQTKVSHNIPAGTGKFPPVTCGNRRQSLSAEFFACFCR